MYAGWGASPCSLLYIVTIHSSVRAVGDIHCVSVLSGLNSWTRASVEQSCLDHNSYDPPSSQSTVTAYSCLLLYFLGVQATWPSTYWFFTIVLI